MIAEVANDLAAADIGTFILVNGWVIIKQHPDTWAWISTSGSCNTHQRTSDERGVVDAVWRLRKSEEYYTINYARRAGFDRLPLADG